MHKQTGFEFPKPFIRQGAFPLDDSSVFNSLEDAKNYVNNNPIAYRGQLISVVDSKSLTVELYMVGFSGSIIKISGMTSAVDNVDNKSIMFKDGKLSLFAFDTIQKEGLSIRTKADGNGGYYLEWFDLNETMEGFNQRILKLEEEIAQRVRYKDAISEDEMKQIINELI